MKVISDGKATLKLYQSNEAEQLLKMQYEALKNMESDDEENLVSYQSIGQLKLTTKNQPYGDYEFVIRHVSHPNRFWVTANSFINQFCKIEESVEILKQNYDSYKVKHRNELKIGNYLNCLM